MPVRTKLNFSFLLFLSLTFITGVIVIALLNKTVPLLAAKALYFCQQFISNTFLTIPNLLPNAIVFILVPVLVFGVLSFLIQLYKTYNLQKGFSSKRVRLPKAVEKITSALDLENKVYLVKDINLFSFCSGILRQRIIITTGFINSLTKKELEAVLLHEKAHLKNLDPIKVLLGKTVSSMFFFLPIFRELNNNMSATNEILADRYVSEHQRETSYLKNALRKILTSPQIKFATVPAISNPDYLEIRISRLTNPAMKHSFGVSWISILTSFIFILLSWFLLQTPVSAFQMEHSMSMDPSYFVCSSDNACRQQCQMNASMSTVSTPQNLFSPQTPKYNVPTYK